MAQSGCGGYDAPLDRVAVASLWNDRIRRSQSDLWDDHTLDIHSARLASAPWQPGAFECFDQRADRGGSMIPGPQLRSPSKFETRFEVPSPLLGKEEAVGEFATDESNRPLGDLLGGQGEALNMERKVARVQEALKERKKGFVGMVNVHRVIEAQRNPSICI